MPGGNWSTEPISETCEPIVLYSILTFSTTGFWPCIELATLNCCVVLPLLFGGTDGDDGGVILSCMYLGTATWKLRPSIGAPVEFVKPASMFVMLGLLGSFEHLNSMTRGVRQRPS